MAAQFSERDRRQLDSFAGRVVVVGDARADGIPTQERVEQCGAYGRQFTQSGLSEPAVMIGDGGGASSVDSVAAGSAVASVGSVPSRPEPGPV